MQLRSTRLLAASAVALLLPLTAPAQAAGPSAGHGFVPADAMAVVTIDMDGLRKAPLYKQLSGMFLKGAQRDIQRLEKMAGFNPEKDVDALVMGVAPGFGTANENFVLAVKVKADEKQIIAAMKKEGAKLAKKKGKGGDYWAIDNEGAIGFRGGWIVLAPLTWWDAMDSGKAGGKLRAAKLGSMVGGLDKKAAVSAVIALPPEIQKQMAQEDPTFNGLRKVAASVKVGSGLDAVISLEMADASAAASFAANLTTQLKAMAAAPEVGQMGLGGTLSATKISSKGKAVTITTGISGPAIQGILGMLQQLMAPGASAPPPMP